MRSRLSSAAGVAVLLALPAGAAYATALQAFIDLQEAGLSLTSAGSGYSGSQVSLPVETNGPIRFALLYWMGRQTGETTSSPAQPYRDQQMAFNGTAITGTVIGTELQSPAVALNVGYFADVTSLVSAAGVGPRTFTFADGNAASNLSSLSGVALVVAYTNPSDAAFYRVQVFDNLDFASGNAADAENRTAQPVTFNHGSFAAPRSAQLYLLTGNATAAGADDVTISNNPTLSNTLDASQGASLDLDIRTVQIPANVASTVVQVNSPAQAGADQLLWEMAALRVSAVPEPGALAVLAPLAAAATARRRRRSSSGG